MRDARNEAVDPGLDVLQAALCYLMDRYADRPSERLAAAVVEQLGRLTRHPEIVLLPVQQRLYARLLNRWRARAFSVPRGGAHNAGIPSRVH